MSAAKSLNRKLIVAVPIAAALASCTGVYDAPHTDSRGQAELAHLLAGKVAGQPQHCLPSYRTTDQQVIDRDTIVYRDGRTIYVQNTNGPCYPHGSSFGYTLVLRKFGTSDTCRGDIAHVIDSSTGTYAGSCSFNDFIPYYTPGRSRTRYNRTPRLAPRTGQCVAADFEQRRKRHVPITHRCCCCRYACGLLIRL
jgi:hypothetical protein